MSRGPCQGMARNGATAGRRQGWAVLCCTVLCSTVPGQRRRDAVASRLGQAWHRGWGWAGLDLAWQSKRRSKGRASFVTHVLTHARTLSRRLDRIRLPEKGSDKASTALTRSHSDESASVAGRRMKPSQLLPLPCSMAGTGQ